MEKVSIIFGTRNRPHNLRRLKQSLLDTSSVMPEVCVYIDDDDVVSAPVAEELGFKYVRGPRQILLKSYDDAAKISTGDILMIGGDDMVFRRHHWDIDVTNEFAKFPDRIVLVWGAGDDYNFPCHCFVHRKWVEATGRFSPDFNGYLDQWYSNISYEIGRQAMLPFTIVEHMNVSIGKAPNDATYIERRANPPIECPKEEVLKDADKLRKIIKSNNNDNKIVHVDEGRVKVEKIVDINSGTEQYRYKDYNIREYIMPSRTITVVKPIRPLQRPLRRIVIE